jgi:hypothetical protein
LSSVGVDDPAGGGVVGLCGEDDPSKSGVDRLEEPLRGRLHVRGRSRAGYPKHQRVRLEHDLAGGKERGAVVPEELVGGPVVDVVLSEASVEHARVDEDHASVSCFSTAYLSPEVSGSVPWTVGIARNSWIAFRWRSISAFVKTIGVLNSAASSALSAGDNVAASSMIL